LIVASAAVWLLLRPKAGQVISPEVRARSALDALSTQPEDGALLSRVSQVLRRYVCAAFALPEGEMNTAEFCKALSSQVAVGSELTGALREFLYRCDERKFAPMSPVPPLGAVAEALKLVDAVEARRGVA
jgi:hypothetical protein